MVSPKAREFIAHCIEKSNQSYDHIAQRSNLSKATVSRAANQLPVSRQTLDILAAYFEVGEQFSTIAGEANLSCAFATELTGELRQTRAYYEAKAVSVRQHYEEQIAALREQNARQEQERTREREMQERNYDKSTAYLKAECERLRAERDEARAQAASASKATSDITGKKHIVFWVLAGIDLLMAVALIIALLTDSIV